MPMKRFVTLIFITAVAAACQQDKLWSGPTQEEEDNSYFNITASELSSKSFSLDDVQDPGTITEPYNYFSSISWDQWRHLRGEERHNALEIPQETLRQMTTLALVESAVNHPQFAEQAYAFNFPLAAMNGFVDNTALFRELCSRSNAPDILVWTFGHAAPDPLDLQDPEAYNRNRDWEASLPLDKLPYISYNAFLLLMASDRLDFSKSHYLDYFKAVTASKITEAGLDLSGNTSYYCEPLLILWDKYFGNLPSGICMGAYPYVF